MSKVASVILSKTVRSFDKVYSYIIPESFWNEIFIGARVIVPFGKNNRSLEAFVIEIIDDFQISKLSYKVKEIKKILKDVPSINIDLLRLSLWMKKRYICTYYETIKCMIPPGSAINTYKYVKLINYSINEVYEDMEREVIDILKEYNGILEYDEVENKSNQKNVKDTIEKLIKRNIIMIEEEYSAKIKEKKQKFVFLKEDKEKVFEDIENNKFKRIQQIKALELLIDVNYILQSDLIKYLGISKSTIDTLKNKNYINIEKLEVKRDPFRENDVEKTNNLILNNDQRIVFKDVSEDIKKDVFCESIIHGITGSGKTEVYLQIIQEVISLDKSAIVLVPEISLTPQMVNRFRSRFENEVAVLHSGLSLGERYDQWKSIKKGEIKIVIGARSAVFAPVENLGIIIIDEEHESSYKSDSNPRYHVREIARQRCKMSKAYLLMGSATPSIESYYRANTGKTKLFQLKKRANEMDLPKVFLADMRRELEIGNRSMFSEKLESEIRENIKRKEQTILFVNRRGHSSFVLCRECGEKIDCKYCNITMTYHLDNDRLICHYCGYTKRSPKTCPKCNSKKIKQFGTGTQKVVEVLKNKFPDSKIIRMDSDVTSYKNSHQKILEEFIDSKIDILVGTQMIAKGHDFPTVTLVGVLSADGLLETGDFRATEKTFQLLTQVSGRAGRGDLKGRSVIQSYNVENYSIQAAKLHDYEKFYNQEILLREKLNYPPFLGIVMVNMTGIDDNKVLEIISYIKNIVSEKANEGKNNISVNGPVRSPISKIRDRFRWRIIIKYDNLNYIVSLLSCINDWYYKKFKKTDIKLNIDINPYNML
ncbi:MAG: primosomal protein N' [Clostridiales bacterium]